MGVEKIKSREAIKIIAADLRMRDTRIVTTNGAFDILHRGHIHTFEIAKQQGDVLIVGLNSDASIKRYKSETRPINTQTDRAYLLSMLEMIDYITIFDEDDPRAFLNDIRPTFHVKSRKGYKGIEQKVVERYGGRIFLIDDLPGYSTSEVLMNAVADYYKNPPRESYD